MFYEFYTEQEISKKGSNVLEISLHFPQITYDINYPAKRISMIELLYLK